MAAEVTTPLPATDAAKRAEIADAIDPRKNFLMQKYAGEHDRYWANACDLIAASDLLRQPATVQGGVREAFEAWYETAHCPDAGLPMPASRGSLKREVDPDFAEHIWKAAWQAALSTQQPAAEGWVLVPREPTPEMLMDGQERVDMPFDENGNGLNVDHTAADVYRIMLAAAPAPPSPAPAAAQGLSEEERKTIEQAKLGGGNGYPYDVVKRLLAIIYRLTSAAGAEG